VADDLAVHFFILGGWQGADGLGQHLEICDQQGYLAGARAHERAGGLDKVAQVEVLFKEREALFAQFVDAQHQLDAPAAVFHMRRICPVADGRSRPPSANFGVCSFRVGFLEGGKSGHSIETCCPPLRVG
jgi:hypothetical protein